MPTPPPFECSIDMYYVFDNIEQKIVFVTFKDEKTASKARKYLRLSNSCPGEKNRYSVKYADSFISILKQRYEYFLINSIPYHNAIIKGIS